MGHGQTIAAVAHCHTPANIIGVADVQHLVGHLAKLPRLQRLGLVVILARLVEIGDGEPVKRLFESAALVCWSELAGVRAGVSVVSPFCLGRP